MPKIVNQRHEKQIVEILDTNDLIFHVKYIFFVSANISFTSLDSLGMNGKVNLRLPKLDSHMAMLCPGQNHPCEKTPTSQRKKITPGSSAKQLEEIDYVALQRKWEIFVCRKPGRRLKEEIDNIQVVEMEHSLSYYGIYEFFKEFDKGQLLSAQMYCLVHKLSVRHARYVSNRVA